MDSSKRSRLGQNVSLGLGSSQHSSAFFLPLDNYSIGLEQSSFQEGKFRAKSFTPVKKKFLAQHFSSKYSQWIYRKENQLLTTLFDFVVSEIYNSF
jgi:hypothetical protein